MSETAERKTPLYETHKKYKGKIVPFAGYLLPVQYEAGVVKEHMAVRTACGLFLRGKKAGRRRLAATLPGFGFPGGEVFICPGCPGCWPAPV